MKLTRHENKLAQRTINETTGTSLKIDGMFGPASAAAVAVYQKKVGAAPTGALDGSTWDSMQAHIDKRFISLHQIIAAAEGAGIPPAVLLALWEVESIGEGFLSDGRLVVLFERHKFYQYVGARLGKAQAEAWRKTHPLLCHPLWDSSVYIGGKGEWRRVGEATTLDAVCTLLSCSWGLFQTMGFNYALMGYQDVQSMVGAYKEGEIHQLRAAVRFITAQGGMLRAARARNFTELARLYNGAAFAKHNYHTRLKTAHDKWAQTLA